MKNGATVFRKLMSFAGLAVLTWILVGCGGAEDRKAKYMERGQALFEEGDFVKAELEFKNVLQIDPKDAEALFMLGQTAERQQQWRGAFSAYSGVLEVDPKHQAALVRRGHIFLLSGSPDRALQDADTALGEDPGNVDALVLRSAVQSRSGDADAALADARAAIEADPRNKNAVAMLASLLAEQGDIDQALRLVEGALEIHPDAIDIHLLLARLYSKKGEPDKAVAQLEEMVVLQPENLTIRVQLAAYLTGQNKLDEAEKILRDAVTDLPDNVAAKLALVEFLGTKRGSAQAEQTLQGFVTAAPDAYALMFAQANLYKAMRQQEKMMAVYSEIIERDQLGPDGLKARNKLAAQLFARGESDAAKKLVEEVLAESAQDSDALLTQAGIALSEKDTDRAVADLRTLLKNDPTLVKALRLLARAHLMRGEMDLARESLEKAAAADPKGTEANLELAQYLLRSGDADAAVAVLESLLLQRPDEIIVMQTLANLRITRKEWDEARALAGRIKEKHVDRAEGYYLSGLVMQGEGLYQESIAEFEQALTRSPDAVQPLVAMARSYLANKQPDEALARLDKAVEANPKNAVARNLQGEILASQQRLAEAEQAFEGARAVTPQWALPYRNLGNLYFAQEENAKAEKVLREGLEATSGNAELGLLLATLLQRSGDREGAIAIYEQMIAKQPQSDVLINNLAVLLAEDGSDQGRLDRALELAQRFEESKSPMFRDTLGWVYYQRNELDKALPLLEQVVASMPNVPTFHFHLGMAYQKSGNVEEAKKQLQAALDTEVEFPEKEQARAIIETL